VSDISNRGIYLISPRKRELGSTLQFRIPLAGEMIGGADALIDAHGKVVGVETYTTGVEESIGVAATIERFEIQRDAVRPCSSL
jgi:hypothetical protein